MKNGDWNDISGTDDIAALMSAFGHFHDSCIKELHYESGMYVDHDLYMAPVNTKRNVSIIFQRQDKNPSAIELQFGQIDCLVLHPVDEHYTGEILEADMIVEDDNLVWADSRIPGKSQALTEQPWVSWIKAKTARWRPLENSMGVQPLFTLNG